MQTITQTVVSETQHPTEILINIYLVQSVQPWTKAVYHHGDVIKL